MELDNRERFLVLTSKEELCLIERHLEIDILKDYGMDREERDLRSSLLKNIRSILKIKEKETKNETK